MKNNPLIEDSIFLKAKKFLPDKVKVNQNFGTEVISDFLIKKEDKEIDTFYFGKLDYKDRDSIIELYSYNVGLVIVDFNFFTAKDSSLVKNAFLRNHFVKYAFNLENDSLAPLKGQLALIFSKAEIPSSIIEQNIRLEVSPEIVFNVRLTSTTEFDLTREIIKHTLKDSEDRYYNGRNLRNSTVEYDSHANFFKMQNTLHGFQHERYLNVITRGAVESNIGLAKELNKILDEVYPIIKPFVQESSTTLTRCPKKLGLAILGIYYNREGYQLVVN